MLWHDCGPVEDILANALLVLLQASLGLAALVWASLLSECLNGPPG